MIDCIGNTVSGLDRQDIERISSQASNYSIR